MTVNPDDIIIKKQHSIFTGNLNTLYETITFSEEAVPIPIFQILASTYPSH